MSLVIRRKKPYIDKLTIQYAAAPLIFTALKKRRRHTSVNTKKVLGDNERAKKEIKTISMAQHCRELVVRDKVAVWHKLRR